MSLLNKLFGKDTRAQEKQPTSNNGPEHAVIVRFNYGIQGLDSLYQLEGKLETLITSTAF